MHRALADVPHPWIPELRLELWKDTTSLTVLLQAGEVTHRRTVTLLNSNCAEVIQSVVLLVRSWLMTAPQGPSPGGFEVAPAPHGPPPSPPEVAPPPQEALPAPIATPLEPPPLADAGLPSPGVYAQPRRVPGRVSALLSGGGILGGAGNPGGTSEYEGSAALEGEVEWGGRALLGASLASPLATHIDVGSISVSRMGFWFLTGLQILRIRAAGVDGLLGARLERWGASASGFTTDKARPIWVPGGAAAVRARLALAERVFAFFTLEGDWTASPTFEISGVGDTARFPRFWMSAAGGLGLRL
jgi:hypothetical protein